MMTSESTTDKTSYGNADYVFSGNVMDGWVWPIGIDYRGVNSPMGPRWGTNHNDVDLGGKAWPKAPYSSSS